MLRRTFISSLLASTWLSFLGGPVSAKTFGTNYVLKTTPFTLGVASGDATTSAVILWTRLAPIPMQENGGMSGETVSVRWRVATDPEMQHVIKHGETTAVAELAHSVHVDVTGLKAGTDYWYEFSAGDWKTITGKTKTLPEGDVENIRFVTASCQHYEEGFFNAYKHMIDDKPDFLLHLGDYIYDVSFGSDVRKHESEKAPVTVAEYRARHTLYRLDEDLQAAHAAFPFYVVLDNHDALSYDNPEARAQRDAAYKVWYEHMPIRTKTHDFATSIEIGELVKFYIPDTRQFREEIHPCSLEGAEVVGFGVYRPDCSARQAPDRTMLGAEQEASLNDSFKTSKARWNSLCSTVPFSPYEVRQNGIAYHYAGGWDGYPAARARLIKAAQEAELSNFHVLSGDIHSAWVTGMPSEEGSGFSIPEFVTTALSSGWPPPLDEPVTASLKYNDHVEYYGSKYRGYALHTVTKEKWGVEMRAVDTVENRNSKVFTQAHYVMENGNPNPVKV